MTTIWIDGEWHTRETAKVSVYDHGLLYGDGVFEGIRVYSGRIFKGEQHLRRLWDSAKAIRLVIPYSQQELAAAMQETVSVNDFAARVIRLVVTRGPGSQGITPYECSRPCANGIADSIEMYDRERYEQAIGVITAPVIRNHPTAHSPRIKSRNHLNNVLARIEAVDA